MVLRADPSGMVAFYSDAPTYLVPAHSLIQRGAFLDNRGKPNVHRTPGYPVFLAGIMSVVGRELRTVLITQAIVLSFGPLVLYWLARRLLPEVMAIIGGVIAAFSPWGAVLAVVPQSDGLFMVVLTVLFLVMKVTVDSEAPRALLGAACVGVLTGVAVLVRPISPLVVLVPAALYFGFWRRRRGAWLLLAISLACAVGPVALWTARNQREAHFSGLSDISAQTAWQYLAARVRAEANGQDRYAVSALAAQEEYTWGLPLPSQELDNERWRRAGLIFRQHPIRTAYTFARDAFEHTIHPSPDVLEAGRMRFNGDVVVLGLWWGGLLLASTYALWQLRSHRAGDDGHIDQGSLITIFIICTALTLSSGISFGAGSRLRAPLEGIVPLLAAVGIMHFCRAVHSSWWPAQSADVGQPTGNAGRGVGLSAVKIPRRLG